MSTKDKEIRRLVISTVGTSLLTNQIDSKSKSQSDWYSCLQDTANLTETEIDKGSDIDKIIQSLKQRAEKKLEKANTIEIREASAELNGIYGLYEDQLENGKLDHHFLITTDTAQGQVTANIVEKFLRVRKFSVEVYTPEKLSTANTKAFNNGIDNLLDWLHRRVNEYQEKKYEIYFNLVGGFKALQGCMNTMGMFYADKIIYVFEGASSNLITIPRLPITVDSSRLTDHVPTLALLDAGAGLLPSKTEKIPEAMIAEIDGKMTLSNWGQLIWKKYGDDFLSQDLLDFPKISYAGDFRGEYKQIKDVNNKIRIQKTIAKVSRILEESNGNTREVGKQVEYYPYEGSKDKEGVDHFYVGDQFRISCKIQNGILKLRHYGTHKYVEGKETT
ncbi:putative CRISPR-associated protein [Microcoleus sp. MOSTC5]|uniref:putative CRISPR-associated protein n=1 Tax=Microcoleus sp. MOSTC5 TaxID=3055378 RepID=UPI002FD0D0AE